MFVQNFVDSFSGFFVVWVEIKHVSDNVPETFVRKQLKVFDDVDDFARRVRVLDLSLVSQVSQLGKGFDQSVQRILRNVGSVLPEHGQLGFDAGVVDGVTAEQISEWREKIISEKRKSGTIGQNDHPEVGVHFDNGIVIEEFGSWNNPASVREHHLAGFDQSFQNASHMEWSFVGLINYLKI